MGAHADMVRAVYQRWAKGDFRAGVELFDPDIVFTLSPGFPDAGDYHGREEVAAYMRAFLEPWIGLTITLEAIEEFGENVLATVRQRGAGEGSGAVTEFSYFQVWSFRGDRVASLQNLRQRESALEAAGAG